MQAIQRGEIEMTPGMVANKYSRFIMCPDCGNKRCPKASDHELECTGSNELGQPGSVYQYN